MGRNRKYKKSTKTRKTLQCRRISQGLRKFSQPYENFAMLGIFAKLRKFRNIAKFRKLCENGRNFRRGCVAKMPASLLLASAASPIFALMLLFQLEFFMNELDS